MAGRRFITKNEEHEGSLTNLRDLRDMRSCCKFTEDIPYFQFFKSGFRFDLCRSTRFNGPIS